MRRPRRKAIPVIMLTFRLINKKAFDTVSHMPLTDKQKNKTKQKQTKNKHKNKKKNAVALNSTGVNHI